MRQRRRTIFLVILVSMIALVIVQQERHQTAGKSTDQTAPSENETRSKRSAPSGNSPKESSQNNKRTKPSGISNNEDLSQNPASSGNDERSDRSGDIDTRAGSKSSQSKATKQAQIEFNRKLDKIIYSRHGRCRMDCRNIDEFEIKEIRDKGKINWEKSDPDAERDPRFALEGITRDNQLVRVVFAQTKDALVLVTCIDLKTDWTCHCN